MAESGFGEVVSFNSVGSLRPQLAPGVLVSCSDYVDLQVGPATFGHDEVRGGSPGIANSLLAKIVGGCTPEFPIATGQTYVQMRGPRFETKAEIRVIRNWGDVVGMTLAHEADLCTEAGVRCTSLGMVDNYANGIEQTALDVMKFKRLVQENQDRVDRFIARLLEVLA